MPVGLEKLELREQSQRPQTLDDARLAVLSLPGIDHLVPDVTVPTPDIDRSLDRMVEQVTLQLDAENMLPLIKYNMGWSDAEADQFFANPERQPYTTPVKFSENLGERANQFLIIGDYLRHRYTVAREYANVAGETNHKETHAAAQYTRENFRNFFEYTLYNLFSLYDNGYKDRLNGINPDERRAGTIRPSDEILDLMREETQQVAQVLGIDSDKLYRDALTATEGGNFITIGTFLMNNKGAPVVRIALERIFIRRVGDPNLAREKVQLIWAAETYRLAMGIDLETFYDLSELPDGKTIDMRIHEFLTNPAYVESELDHLKREAEPVFASWEQSRQPMNYFDILQARAEYHNFSDSVSSPTELELKKQKIWRQLSQILPLAFLDTPLSYIDAPTNMGANPRAVNITYHNREDKIVNVVVLNAREQEDDLRETTGHELGHKLHAEMLKRAEDAGYVPSGSNERVPGSIKEEFSQLVEDQVGRIWSGEKVTDTTAISPHQADPAKRGEFRDLAHAIVVRRQGPYALTQRAVRLEMEKLWNGGKRDHLTDDEADILLGTLQPHVDKWYSEGIPIVSPVQRVNSNLNMLGIDDGLVYLRKYVVGAPSPSQGDGETHAADIQIATEQPIDMKTAFDMRFGDQWLLNADARAVLLALLAETGKNYDITTYGRYVLDADLDAVKTTLRSWGITEEII